MMRPLGLRGGFQVRKTSPVLFFNTCDTTVEELILSASSAMHKICHTYMYINLDKMCHTYINLDKICHTYINLDNSHSIYIYINLYLDEQPFLFQFWVYCRLHLAQAISRIAKFNDGKI